MVFSAGLRLGSPCAERMAPPAALEIGLECAHKIDRTALHSWRRVGRVGNVPVNEE